MPIDCELNAKTLPACKHLNMSGYRVT